MLNAGLGLANTGFNAAIGNSSENDVELEQDAHDQRCPAPAGGRRPAGSPQRRARRQHVRRLRPRRDRQRLGHRQPVDDGLHPGGIRRRRLRDRRPSSAARPTPVSAWPTPGLNFGLGNNSTNRAVLDQDGRRRRPRQQPGRGHQRLGRHMRRSAIRRAATTKKRQGPRSPASPARSVSRSRVPSSGRGRHRSDAPAHGLRPAAPEQAPQLTQLSTKCTRAPLRRGPRRSGGRVVCSTRGRVTTRSKLSVRTRRSSSGVNTSCMRSRECIRIKSGAGVVLEGADCCLKHLPSRNRPIPVRILEHCLKGLDRHRISQPGPCCGLCSSATSGSHGPAMTPANESGAVA